MRRSLLVAAVFALAAAAGAQAVPKSLSAACCELFLTELVYLKTPGTTGVPPYVMGMGEAAYALSDGASFTVGDGEATEQVVFSAADFADISAATPEEVMDAINAQLTLGEAMVDSGMLMLRGLQGGASAELELGEGAGDALMALGLPAGMMNGADDIELRLATDLEMAMGDDHEGGLAGHPYLVVVSATEGVTPVAGWQVPLAVDATTLLGLRAIEAGLLPGFLGNLDAEGGATVSFDAALLPKMFPGGLPERLHFAFVVFEEDLSGIALVGNAFSVAFED